MFQKDQLDKVFSELKSEWFGKPEYEQLIRDVHLGIAYYDAGRSLQDIDPKAVSLIEKHAQA